MPQFVIGLLLGILIAYAAYRARSLDRSGMLTAAALGTVVFGLGGLPWAVLLMVFFISSSALSRLFKRRKARVEEKFSKGSRRDAGQVLANGGVAGSVTLVYFALSKLLPPGSPALAWAWLAFAASLAAANADTWATELGVLSRADPVLITSGRRVERGTSGGISLVGTLAALGGAALVALFTAGMDALGWTANASHIPALALLVMLAGLLGSLIDSLLGATVQAIYYCPKDDKETERHPLHTCGTPTTLKRGWPWLNNDWVNGACTLSAALLVLALAWVAPGMAASGADLAAQEAAMTLPLTSPAFENGKPIPAAYTCDGADRSPALAWSELPAGTQSLALIVDDPDAPGGTFTHWVAYNLPLTSGGLAEGWAAGETSVNEGTQGRSGFGRSGYGGPCPPGGKPHRYFFRLYALDAGPNLPPGLTAGQLREAMQGHVLAQGEWMGTYQRQ